MLLQPAPFQTLSTPPQKVNLALQYVLEEQILTVCPEESKVWYQSIKDNSDIKSNGPE